MSEYKFNKQGNTANYEINVDTAACYGYFEHHTLGDESAGGLWFQKSENDPTRLELIDYDGVVAMPIQVFNWLKEQGFIVSKEFA